MLDKFGFSSYERWAIYLLVILVLGGASVRAYRHYKLSQQAALWVRGAGDSTIVSSFGTSDYPSTERPLNINNAPALELELLPGIGPIKAQKIVDYRNTHGAFARADDLENVPGIGPKTMMKLKPIICCK